MLDDQGLLLTIFRDLQPSEWLQLSLISKEKTGRMLFFHDPLELLETAEAQGATQHCFFGVGIRRDRSGILESVTRIGAVWADMDAKDFDDDKDTAKAATRLLTLPPSFLIDSGHGYHAYWLLKEPGKTEDVCAVTKAVGELIGGGSVSDAARVMRLPGTWNVKNDEALLCRVVSANSSLRYDLEDILKATQISSEIRKSILTGEPSKRAKDKTRSGNDWRVGTELKNLGLSEEALRVIWAEYPIGEKAREEGAHYLDHTLAELAKREKKALQAGQPSAYFEQEGDAYYVDGIGRRGRHIVSTFVFEPRRLLVGEVTDDFLGDVVAGGRRWEGIQLPKGAFTRIDTLVRQLGRAEWQWLGNDEEVRFLLPYLVQKWKDMDCPQAQATQVLGRHGDVWVTEHTTLSATEIMDIYDAPIVFEPTGRLVPRVSYELGADRKLLQNIHERLSLINAPGVILPILGWFMATPFKSILNDARISFPHLALFGTTGAGKTSTLEAIFLPLMGYIKPARSEDCSTTPFVMLSLLASTNSIPVSLAEFRRSTLGETAWRSLLRTLLLAYDVGHDSRGKPSQTTVDYPLHAPLVISGEDIITDPAVQRRSIIVGMTPQHIVQGSTTYSSFMDLSEMPLSLFATKYIQYTLGLNADTIVRKWEEAVQELQECADVLMDERTTRNYATVLFGIRAYEEFMMSNDITVDPIEAVEVLAPLHDDIRTGTSSRGYIILDSFAEDIINEAARGSDRFVYAVDQNQRNILWFHLTTAFQWWRQDRLHRQEPVLDSASVKRQLREMYTTVDGPGHYVLEPKVWGLNGSSRRMYGFNLDLCLEAGMDIPEVMNIMQKTITFQGSNRTLTEVE